MARFEKGSAVFFSKMRANAKIEQGPNNKGLYLLSVGAVKVWAPESEIKEAKVSTVKTSKTVTNQLSNEENKTFKLDLHGLTVSLAIEQLEKTIDRCLIDGYSRIEILHGLGSGKVKDAVTKYLSQSKHVIKNFIDPGNPGITWALF